MQDDMVKIIQETSLFKGLPDDAAREIASITNLGRFRKNQILFVEGMPANALFLVLSGKVKVYRSTHDGRELVLHLLKHGEPVAVVPFFDQGPYPATAEVIEDGELAYILADDFDRLTRDNPNILRRMVSVLSRRLRNAQEQIASLGLGDAQSRVVDLLLQLADQHGVVIEEGVQITLDLTRQDLGNFIGVSRETTTRLLNQFKRSGAIDVDGSVITILDEEKLLSWRDR